MPTAFGPQATNASLTLPTANKNRYGGADTWFQDETVPGRNDATVLDAQFLNVLLGNIRSFVQSTGVTMKDGDMGMLTRAIQAAVNGQAISSSVITDATPLGRSILAAVSAATLKTILQIQTTDIVDSGATGRALIRTKTLSDLKGITQTVAADITDATALGKMVLTATSLSGAMDASFGTTRGTVVVRGASGWVPLTATISGATLQFDGTDLAFATASPGAGSLRYDTAQTLTAAQKTQAQSNIGLVLQGYIGGLTIANNASSPNTVVDIAPGIACSDDGTTMMRLASALSKSIASAWAVGSGNGGLDTGTVAANTWYHVFEIERLDTGVVDGIFSTSLTPSMPTNYTTKRRLGSVRTDTSGNILAFKQLGDEFLWANALAEVTGFNLSLSAQACNLYGAPSGVKTTALLRSLVGQTGSAVNSVVNIFSPDETVTFPPAANAWMGGAVSSATGGAFAARVRTSAGSPAQVSIISNNASGTSISVGTYGWVDDRGKAA